MRIRNHLLLATILWMLASPAPGPAEEHGPEHTWSYSGAQGPAHWGDLKPEFGTCKTGHRQSPIDIRDTRKADLAPIQFDYKPSPLHIVDNGHTIMINYGPGSYITVGGKTYRRERRSLTKNVPCSGNRSVSSTMPRFSLGPICQIRGPTFRSEIQ
jgi:carbonic anhydrase